MKVNHLRKEYRAEALRRSTAKKNPYDQLRHWLAEALEAHVDEPNAMVLATATSKGHPSSRTVLLKAIEDHGLTFFTSYESRKAMELAENPYASATFLWMALERQICIEGNVTKSPRDVSEAYFATRPRTSQIAAWASHQDAPLESREALEAAYRQCANEFEGKTIPCPPFWGGYVLAPTRFEFWQGRPSRLHDRIVYLRHENEWVLSRLSP